MRLSGRMRRDIRLINKAMRNESYRWGQQVIWYPFNPASVEDEDSDDPGTGYDADLYDEGGLQQRAWSNDTGTSRRWGEARPVQVQMARMDEGMEQFSDQGSYDVDRLTIIVSRQALADSGIDPDEDRHNDRVVFDGRTFAVNHFDKRGRISDTYLTATVTCAQVMDDEMQTDDVPWYAS
jgi:hypothetical protein